MSSEAVPALSVRNVSKTFTGTRVLSEVGIDVMPGEVRSLVGQNGSGKSTLIKILAGYHDPDPGGSAEIAGQPLALGDAAAAFEAGLRFVHQDLGLVPALSAIENLALGRGFMRDRFGSISWRRERQAGNELLRQLGYDFDFRAPVSNLTASERTGIAIARALEGWEGQVKLLVLDEPTASLPAAEVARLFEVVGNVKERGVAIIYVSHHFNEVFEISDSVTVLRDGRHIATRPIAELDEPALINLTIGRTLEEFEPPRADSASASSSQPALSLEGLSGSVLEGLDLEVRPGEIVGVAGVTGSGREQVAGLVFGALEREGTVRVDGEEVPAERPDLSMRCGMAFVPPDRAAKAALSDLTLRENTTISRLDPFYGLTGLRPGAERKEAEHWLDRLEVVPRDSEAIFNTLSGGNQQKVVLARALRLAPRALILDEPTQGVDVGAKASIHKIIAEAAEAGTGVLVASTESEELISLCHRVVVLNRGVATANLATAGLAPDDLTDYTLRGAAAASV